MRIAVDLSALAVLAVAWVACYRRSPPFLTRSGKGFLLAILLTYVVQAMMLRRPLTEAVDLLAAGIALHMIVTVGRPQRLLLAGMLDIASAAERRAHDRRGNRLAILYIGLALLYIYFCDWS